MQTKCTPDLFEFEAVERRAVVASFDGGTITSNADALLLRQVDRGSVWCAISRNASSTGAILASSSIGSRRWSGNASSVASSYFMQ